MAKAVVPDLYSSRPDLYDLMHADHTDDVRFLEDFVAGLGDGASILELGCGTGRLILPLLTAGARVSGLDCNGTMLEVARRRLGLYSDRVRLVEGDMRRFSLPERFDLVVIGLNTFMHLLTANDQLDCLEAIHDHLRPGGTLLLDLANPHAAVRDTPLGVVQHRFTRSVEHDASTPVTLWSSTMLAAAAQLTLTTLFFDETEAATGLLRRTMAEVTLRLTYRFELELLLARTGFSVKHLYGDYESSPYDDDGERLLCIASALA